jgi:hypothetical protein
MRGGWAESRTIAAIAARLVHKRAGALQFWASLRDGRLRRKCLRASAIDKTRGRRCFATVTIRPRAPGVFGKHRVL